MLSTGKVNFVFPKCINGIDHSAILTPAASRTVMCEPRIFSFLREYVGWIGAEEELARVLASVRKLSEVPAMVE